MSQLTTENLAFKKIQNTLYDSKVFEGLYTNGILVRTLEQYICTVDLEDLDTGSAVIQTLVDDRTGEQVVLVPGQMIVGLRGGATTLVATEANLDLFQVGLSLTTTGAHVYTVSNAATGEILGASTGTGLTLTTNNRGGVVTALAQYVTVSTTVTSAALTAGVIKIFLQVV